MCEKVPNKKAAQMCGKKKSSQLSLENELKWKPNEVGSI